VPIPDERIPVIAGSTVGGTAGFLLLLLLVYMLYQYIQERRLLRRCGQVKLEDTYPITDLYRNPTFIGSRDHRQARGRQALGRTSHGSMERTESAGMGRKRSSADADHMEGQNELMEKALRE
jgi:hypothetical protein